jgi:lysophospholipase L1-like esterase
MSRKKNAKKLWTVVGLVLLAAASVSVVAAALTSIPDKTAEAASFTPAPIPTKAPKTVALWVGDSFTLGVGATDPGYSYAVQTSIAMGWTEAIDAQSGTGFVADGKNNAKENVPVPARLERFTGNPQYVIVDAGRNDWNQDFKQATAPAVKGYLDAVKAKWPAAKLILIVPFNVASTKATPDFVNLFAEESQRLGATVVNPIAEGWLNKDTMADKIYSDNVHPNRAGHKYIAEHLAESFKALGIVPATKG